MCLWGTTGRTSPLRTWSLGDSIHWRWLLWLGLTDPACSQPQTGHVSVQCLPQRYCRWQPWPGQRGQGAWKQGRVWSMYGGMDRQTKEAEPFSAGLEAKESSV